MFLEYENKHSTNIIFWEENKVSTFRNAFVTKNNIITHNKKTKHFKVLETTFFIA